MKSSRVSAGWARQTLARLTLQEKVAQMFGVRAAISLAAGEVQELQGSLDQVLQQVDRCTAIIRNLLNFARRREPVVQAVDVNRIIEDMTMLVEKEARNNNIAIERRYDPNLLDAL